MFFVVVQNRVDEFVVSSVVEAFADCKSGSLSRLETVVGSSDFQCRGFRLDDIYAADAFAYVALAVAKGSSDRRFGVETDYGRCQGIFMLVACESHTGEHHETQNSFPHEASVLLPKRNSQITRVTDARFDKPLEVEVL
jgi:hypothetical protein